MRVYRLAVGHWGFGLHRSSGGWHFEVFRWVFTTEP